MTFGDYQDRLCRMRSVKGILGLAIGLGITLSTIAAVYCYQRYAASGSCRTQGFSELHISETEINREFKQIPVLAVKRMRDMFGECSRYAYVRLYKTIGQSSPEVICSVFTAGNKEQLQQCIGDTLEYELRRDGFIDTCGPIKARAWLCGIRKLKLYHAVTGKNYPIDAHRMAVEDVLYEIESTSCDSINNRLQQTLEYCSDAMSPIEGSLLDKKYTEYMQLLPVNPRKAISELVIVGSALAGAAFIAAAQGGSSIAAWLGYEYAMSIVGAMWVAIAAMTNKRFWLECAVASQLIMLLVPVAWLRCM